MLKIVCRSINLNKRVIDCMVVYAVSAISQPWRFLKNVINCVIHLKRNNSLLGKRQKKKKPQTFRYWSKFRENCWWSHTSIININTKIFVHSSLKINFLYVLMITRIFLFNMFIFHMLLLFFLHKYVNFKDNMSGLFSLSLFRI